MRSPTAMNRDKHPRRCANKKAGLTPAFLHLQGRLLGRAGAGCGSSRSRSSCRSRSSRCRSRSGSSSRSRSSGGSGSGGGSGSSRSSFFLLTASGQGESGNHGCQQNGLFHYFPLSVSQKNGRGAQKFFTVLIEPNSNQNRFAHQAQRISISNIGLSPLRADMVQKQCC
ncbi:hypothetical protein GALL_453350 [mine drainage metagenome]|uniref:Uncharacterized protein n=1 Tax=mine drainage metagenome TaxID=410659 RepID=A0A1J5PN88_9ZZZZ